jgi:hypothetical protein
MMVALAAIPEAPVAEIRFADQPVPVKFRANFGRRSVTNMVFFSHHGSVLFIKIILYPGFAQRVGARSGIPKVYRFQSHSTLGSRG